MANIFDILLDAGITVKNNTYISWGYVTYQVNLSDIGLFLERI